MILEVMLYVSQFFYFLLDLACYIVIHRLRNIDLLIFFFIQSVNFLT